MVDLAFSLVMIDENGSLTSAGRNHREQIVRSLDRHFKNWVESDEGRVRIGDGYISDIDSIFTVCADAVQRWYEAAKERENANR